MKFRILITSVGSKVGQALLESLDPVRDEIEIIGTNTIALAANIFQCDKVYLVPSTCKKKAYIQSLIDILVDQKIDMVIPARDEELPILAQLNLDPRFCEVNFLAAPLNLCSIFNDKYQTYLFSKQNLLPFAPTAYYEEEVWKLLSDEHFLIVAKSRWKGHASKNVYLLDNEDQVEFLLGEGSFVFQPFLNPPAIEDSAYTFTKSGIPWVFSVKDEKHIAELVIGKSGEVISLSCNVSHETAEYGDKAWSVIDNLEVETIALRYAECLAKRGYRGPLNLQGKLMPDGTFVPFELNGRFTGSTIARTVMGYNQVLHAFTHFLKGHPSFPPHRPGKYVCAVRKPQNYEPLRGNQVDVLSNKKCWP